MMGKVLRWTKQAKEDARRELRDALTLQFNGMYGTDVNDVKNWQFLCRVLGIAPVPEHLSECRQVRSVLHVQRAILNSSTGGVEYACQSC